MPGRSNRWLAVRPGDHPGLVRGCRASWPPGEWLARQPTLQAVRYVVGGVSARVGAISLASDDAALWADEKVLLLAPASRAYSLGPGILEVGFRYSMPPGDRVADATWAEVWQRVRLTAGGSAAPGCVSYGARAGCVRCSRWLAGAVESPMLRGSRKEPRPPHPWPLPGSFGVDSKTH